MANDTPQTATPPEVSAQTTALTKQYSGNLPYHDHDGVNSPLVKSATAWEIVSTQIFSLTNLGTTFTKAAEFLNLSGEGDQVYKLIFQISSPTNNTRVVLRFNDNTSSNYYATQVGPFGAGGAIQSATDTSTSGIFVLGTDAGAASANFNGFGEIIIKTNTALDATTKIVLGQCMGFQNGVAPNYFAQVYGGWNDVTSVVASIQLYAKVISGTDNVSGRAYLLRAKFR